MDRLQLLEQKRQRLEELRSRKVAQNEPKPQKKDFAIQKDWQPPLVVRLDERITIDKAIQTDEERLKEPSPTVASADITQEDTEKNPGNEDNHKIPPEEPPHIHNWDAVNTSVRDAIRVLGKLAIPEPFRNYGENSTNGSQATNKLQQTAVIAQDTPTAIAVSATHDRLAVAFSNRAVVYSTSPMYPEYFLETESAITAIMFDNESPSRIIGGLRSGTVVVWDLQSSVTSLISTLPAIRSPRFPIGPSIAHKFSFLHHRAPVCCLVPRRSSAFASVSHDGVVNCWSSHILAAPQSDSVQLGNTQSVFPCHTIRNPGSSPVSDWIVVKENGSISLGTTTFDHSGECRITDGFIANDIFVAAGLDWTFRLWTLDGKVVRVIYSKILVYSMSQRPGYPHQFATIGVSTAGQICLQLWDLDANEPVLQTVIEDYDKMPKLPAYRRSELLVQFVSENELVVATDNLRSWRLYNV